MLMLWVIYFQYYRVLHFYESATIYLSTLLFMDFFLFVIMHSVALDIYLSVHIYKNFSLGYVQSKGVKFLVTKCRQA